MEEVCVAPESVETRSPSQVDSSSAEDNSAAPARQRSARQKVKEEGNAVLSLCCCLAGAGALTGMIFIGRHLWPADALDGRCWVDPFSDWHVTSECKHIGESETPVINTANVTLKDGSVRKCNTFRLSGHCESVYASDDSAPVLRGEQRDCKFLEDDKGRCLEPGMYGGERAGAVICWVLAPCFCCAAWVFAIASCPLVDVGSESSDLPQKSTSKLQIQHSRSKYVRDQGNDSGVFSVIAHLCACGSLVGLIIGGVTLHGDNVTGAIAMWIFAPLLCCVGCFFGLIFCPDSWLHTTFAAEPIKVAPSPELDHIPLRLRAVHDWPPASCLQTLADWDVDQGTSLKITDQYGTDITDKLIANIDFETGTITYSNSGAAKTCFPLVAYQVPRDEAVCSGRGPESTLRDAGESCDEEDNAGFP